MDSREKRLVKEAMQGNSSAFEKLIAPKRREILYLAMRFCGADDAEDIAQEALVHAFRDIAQLKNPEKFNSWLYKLVRHDCLHVMRKKRQERAVPTDPAEETLVEIEDRREEFLPVACIENADKREQLLELVNSLPEKNVNCLMLYYYEGLSHKEIAEVLDSTPKTVSNDLVQARVLLRRKLAAVPHFQYKQGMAVAGMSMLSQVFEADAFDRISPDMCGKLGSDLHVSLSALVATTAGGAGVVGAETAAGTAGSTTGTAATAGAAKAGGLALGAKWAIGLAISVTAIGGGAVLYNQVSAPDEPTPIVDVSENMQAASSEQEAPPAQSVEPAQAEQPIDSLDDMIGADQLRLLDSYVQEGAESSAWADFLQAIEARPEFESTMNDGVVYCLNVLDKQDKRLLLYEEDDGSGRVAIFYEFGTQDSLPIPRMAEVILHFRDG